ncbi:hypothetical protein [Micromonospora sp. NPDC005367]|uniref:hypothetical protein n=1 Tax=Micromonospora sp. NPDC005367 TaxID=3155590 RepID=UPI0033AD5E52
MTAAVRGHRAWEEYRAEQARRGYPLSEQGMAAARARRYELQAAWPEERYAALEQRVADHLASNEPGRQAPAA